MSGDVVSAVLGFLGFFFLAVFIEGLIEYSVMEVLKRRSVPTWWVRYMSAALGVALAFAYEANLPARFGLTSRALWIDYTVTGLIVGRGSNYLSDFIGQLRGARDGGGV